MKGTGLIIIAITKAMKNLAMDQFTKGTMSMESLKDMVDMNGKTMKSMKGNGKEESNMDLEYGEDPKEIRILDNGNRARPKAMACIHGQTEIDTKANSKNVLNMEKEFSDSRMEIPIKATTNVVNLQDMENIIGSLAVFSKAALKMD